MRWMLLYLQSKKRFEREWREAEKAAQYADKTDQDLNATKADVEKVFRFRQKVSQVSRTPAISFPSYPNAIVASLFLFMYGCLISTFPYACMEPQAKQQAHMRTHIAEECKNDYAAQLQKYNKEQSQFYFTDMPQIFNVRTSRFSPNMLRHIFSYRITVGIILQNAYYNQHVCLFMTEVAGHG